MSRATALATRSLLALAFAAVGCTHDDYLGERLETTHRYVLAALDAPRPTADGHAVGFDLDGIVSDGAGTGCVGEVPDFTSPITGSPGVDNQIVSGTSIAPGPSVDDTTRAAIATGEYLLVLEITSTGLRFDPRAEVRVALASSGGRLCDGSLLSCPEGSRCPPSASVEVPARCGPIVDAVTGRIIAGQPLGAETEIATVTGSISGGSLSFELDELPLRMSTTDYPRYELMLTHVHVHADLTGEALMNGEIGGHVTVANLIAASAEVGIVLDEATVRTITAPDLEPDASGTTCAAISAGFSFDAVWGEPFE